MTPEAQRGIAEAFLDVLRARHPGYVWTIVRQPKGRPTQAGPKVTLKGPEVK